MSGLVARARGLEGRILGEAALGEIERAGDVRTMSAALGRVGLLEDAGYATVEREARQRVAEDLAILAQWAASERAAMEVIELDEDCHSLRAIVRGMAAGVSPERRRAATTPTSLLPEHVLAELAATASPVEIQRVLVRRDHPLASAFAEIVDVDVHVTRSRARTRPCGRQGHGTDDDIRPAVIDVLAVEVALTQTFALAVRRIASDNALATFVTQTIDVQNAGSALLLAARGQELVDDDMFIAGGDRLGRGTFDDAAVAPLDRARELLADAFWGTPLARAFDASTPGALEDAALDWQLATQAALRRRDPHGAAGVLHVVLRRRAEARRLRRAAWRVALGGSR
jgi:vacuolar-type H+-ATPase subunit C/Vma6